MLSTYSSIPRQKHKRSSHSHPRFSRSKQKLARLTTSFRNQGFGSSPARTPWTDPSANLTRSSSFSSASTSTATSSSAGAPSFSRLLTTVLGSPFLTTSSIASSPPPSPTIHLSLNVGLDSFTFDSQIEPLAYLGGGGTTGIDDISGDSGPFNLSIDTAPDAGAAFNEHDLGHRHSESITPLLAGTSLFSSDYREQQTHSTAHSQLHDQLDPGASSPAIFNVPQLVRSQSDSGRPVSTAFTADFSIVSRPSSPIYHSSSNNRCRGMYSYDSPHDASYDLNEVPHLCAGPMSFRTPPRRIFGHFTRQHSAPHSLGSEQKHAYTYGAQDGYGYANSPSFGYPHVHDQDYSAWLTSGRPANPVESCDCAQCRGGIYQDTVSPGIKQKARKHPRPSVAIAKLWESFSSTGKSPARQKDKGKTPDRGGVLAARRRGSRSGTSRSRSVSKVDGDWYHGAEDASDDVPEGCGILRGLGVVTAGGEGSGHSYRHRRILSPLDGDDGELVSQVTHDLNASETTYQGDAFGGAALAETAQFNDTTFNFVEELDGGTGNSTDICFEGDARGTEESEGSFISKGERAIIVSGFDILTSLPPELGLHVLSYLSVDNVLTCACVCKTWAALTIDNVVWWGLWKRMERPIRLNTNGATDGADAVWKSNWEDGRGWAVDLARLDVGSEQGKGLLVESWRKRHLHAGQSQEGSANASRELSDSDDSRSSSTASDTGSSFEDNSVKPSNAIIGWKGKQRAKRRKYEDNSTEGQSSSESLRRRNQEKVQAWLQTRSDVFERQCRLRVSRDISAYRYPWIWSWSRSYAGRRRLQPQAIAPLMVDWRQLFKSRLELEKRWRDPSISPKIRRIEGHGDSVYCLDFDSTRIITGSRDKSIKVWSLKTGKLLATFLGHKGSVLCLKFERDWDIPARRQSSKFNAGSSSTSKTEFSYSADSVWDRADERAEDALPRGFMVSGSSDCTVCVWDLVSLPSSGKNGRHRRNRSWREGQFEFESRKNELTIDGATGSVIRRETEVEEEEEENTVCAQVRKVLYGHSGGVLDLRVDDDWIVTCSKDALIIVYSRKTLTLHRVLRGHQGPVNAIGLENGHVVSASGDGKMMLWNVENGERVRVFEGHERGLACIEFKDNLILSGSTDRTIKLWRASTGECLHTFTGHTLLVRALCFDPRSGYIVSASYDRSVRVWEWRENDNEIESQIWKAGTRSRNPYRGDTAVDHIGISGNTASPAEGAARTSGKGVGRLVREFQDLHESHIFDVRLDVGRIVSTSYDQKIVVLDFTDDIPGAQLFI